MKALKYTGIGLLALIILYIVWAMVSPDKIDMAKSIEIDRDSKTVFNQVKDYNFHTAWDPWSEEDPDGKYEVKGSGKDIGDTWSFQSEEIGTGTIRHESEVPFEKFTDVVEITAPFQSTHKENWSFKDAGNGKTLVTWENKGQTDVPFLMRPLVPIMMSSTLEKGLNKLKTKIEKLPAVAENSSPVNVQVEQLGEMRYIGIHDSCEVGKIAERYAAGINKVKAFAEKNKIDLAGSPMAIFSYYDGKTTSFISAFPVKSNVKVSGELVSGTIPAGKSLTTIHNGPYGNSETAHEAIDAYARANKLTTSTAIEIYENDPSKVKPEEIRTKVVYPVGG